MEKTLYDKKGEAVAFIAMDYYGAVFLWGGQPVAYLYEENHLYGINGRHIGWFIDEIVYDQEGLRIGFTSRSCPVAGAERRPKGKRAVLPELRPRWAAPPTPKLTFREAGLDLADFLNQGRA